MQLPLVSRLAIFFSIIGLVSLIILTQSNQDIRQQAKENDSTIPTISRGDFKRGIIKTYPQQVLEVTLHYQATANPELNILSSVIKESFIPPFRKRKAQPYTLLLLNKNGKVISSTPFEVVNEVEEIIPLPGEETNNQEVKFNNFNLVVTIPWNSEGTSIQIKNMSGDVLIASTLGNLQVIPATKEYVTAQPADSSTSMLSKMVSQVSGPPPINYLDVVFISNGYTTSADFDQYHQQVTQMSNYLLTYEPFTSHSSLIRFSSIDNFNDLSCVQSGRLITCDEAKVFQAVNSIGVPYDKVVVVDNKTTYGGSGGVIAVTYNGEWQNEVFVHEFGHVLGNLEDEYIKQSINNDPNVYVRANCFRGTPPNVMWQGVVQSNEYYPGCNYPDWYRSSETSLMRDITSEFFNPISQRELIQAIAFYTDPDSAAVCDADINQDKTVDLNDYSLFLGSVLKNPFPTVRADINKDEKVDLQDYSLLIGSFLKHCPN